MSLSLPKPSAAYDPNNEAQARRAIEQADKANRKNGANVEIGGQKLVLKSPNGTRWSVTVNNSGVLSAVAA
jgi:hypothetical protein